MRSPIRAQVCRGRTLPAAPDMESLHHILETNAQQRMLSAEEILKDTFSMSVKGRSTCSTIYNKSSRRIRCLLRSNSLRAVSGSMGSGALLQHTMYQVWNRHRADVTLITALVYRECEHGSLKPSNRHLNGADQQSLQVILSFTGSLSYDNMETAKEILQ